MAGWRSIRNVPPKEKRGLVLVDPPFEEAGEFERLVDGLVKAHKRFPTGLYALWYPLKDQKELDAFVGTLAETGIARILRVELMVRAPAHPARLFGTGMIIVNPPFTLEAELRTSAAAAGGDPGRRRQGRHADRVDQRRVAPAVSRSGAPLNSRASSNGASRSP